MSESDGELRCPVCRAPFRGTADCSRCSADLRPLMRLVACAYAARQAARQALRAGNTAPADAALRLAQYCHTTPGGTRLATLLTLPLAAAPAAQASSRPPAP